MCARVQWWLLPVLVLGLAACGGDDEVVDPGPGPVQPVVWMLSGDRTEEATGDYAVMELHTAGGDSYVQLLLRVDGGHSLAISSPRGENSVAKTVYDVEESASDDWHARLILSTTGDPEHFVAIDGFVTVEALSQEQVSGFFSLDTQELDDDEELVPGGLKVRVQGTFTARIERSSPGSRAVMKGTAKWLSIAQLGFSR